MNTLFKYQPMADKWLRATTEKRVRMLQAINCTRLSLACKGYDFLPPLVQLNLQEKNIREGDI